MARKTSDERRAEKLAKLDALKAQIAKMEGNATKRFGRLAIRAGLAELNLSDADLLRELLAIAARFRNGSKSQLAKARIRLYRADRRKGGSAWTLERPIPATKFSWAASS